MMLLPTLFSICRIIIYIFQAWGLWMEDKPHELMDPTLMDSCTPSDMLKCINVGPICVQGQPY